MVDYSFYKTEYRKDNAPAILEEEFAFFEERAWDRINIRKITLPDPPEYLKKCICEIAELLYQDGLAPKAGDVISESNSGFSVSVKPDTRSAGEKDREIKEVIRKHLARTPLHNQFIISVLG